MYDWMRGDEPYKFSMSNAVSHAVTLIAWSGPLCETLTDAPRQVKSTLKPVVERHQRLQNVRAGYGDAVVLDSPSGAVALKREHFALDAAGALIALFTADQVAAAADGGSSAQ